MEENPTSPVSEVPNPTPLPAEASANEGPVILSSTGDQSPNDPKPSKKFSLKLVIGIIIFLFLVGGAAAGYVYKDKIVSMVAKPTPTLPPIITATPPPIPSDVSNIYEENGFTFTIPEGYTKIENSDNVEFHRPSGFGLTILKSRTKPFPVPTNSSTLTVSTEKIKLDTTQTEKYTTISTGTELNKDEFVYFKTGSLYYQLQTNIDAGGISIDVFLSTFKFTK